MENNSGLDALIRQVENMKAPHKSSEEIIVPILINPDRKPWEWKKEAFYLVAKRSDRFSTGTCVVPIIAFTEGLRIDLSIAYRVRMSDVPLKSAAETIAVKLYDPTGPQVGLERRIEKWVNEYAEKNGGHYKFIEEYIEHEARLRQDMQRWAREVLCLDLHLQIKILTETVVNETIEIPAFTIKAIFRDNDRVVDLKVETLSLEFAPDPRQKIFAWVRSNETSQLAASIQAKLAEIIRRDYDLHQFRGVNVPPAIKQELKDGLRETTCRFGRTIRALDLRCQTPFFDSPQFYQSPEISFPVTVPQYPHPSKITASIQLELIALGKFAASGIADLNKWVEDTLKSTIVPHVSRHSYLELVTLWETKEKSAIDEELRAKAEEIGYRWVHSNIDTDLPFDRVRRPFQIKLDQAFTTKNSESTVTLHVDAYVKIVNMTVLAAKIPATEIDIDERVKEALIFELRRVAKGHSPKEWHLNFDTHRDAAPLKFVVQEALQRELSSSFGGTLVSITITRDSDLVGTLAKLRTQTPPLKITVTRADLEIQFTYGVKDVDEDEWQRFESTKPSFEKLNERIELHIKQMFADVDPTVFRRMTNSEIIVSVGKIIPKLISEQFGVKIYIDHWIRDRIPVEVDEDELRIVATKINIDQQRVLLEAAGSEKLNDLNWLRKRKIEIQNLIDNRDVLDDAEEIKKLKAELASINQEIKEQSSETLRSIIENTRIGSERQLAASLGHDHQTLANSPDRLLEQSADCRPGTVT